MKLRGLRSNSWKGRNALSDAHSVVSYTQVASLAALIQQSREFDIKGICNPCHNHKVIGSWQCADRLGKTLSMDDISSKITKTAAYRQTICRVDAKDYALHLINGEPNPELKTAKSAQSDFVAALVPLIQSLHQNDFELLIYLLFSRLGWVRISGIGGNQKDTDFVLEQPATKMRALVQVKSAADQSVLDKYERLFSNMPGILVSSSAIRQLISFRHAVILISGRDLS